MTIDQACRDFLQVYFGDDLDGVYVCDSTDWRPQEATSAKLDPDAGWYFCPARLCWLEGGQRLLKNAVSVHALVIDDIGQKVGLDEFKRVATAPSTAVETSKGNWQCGYRLEGVTVAQYDALRRALPWKADGADAVHWWRLPGGTNPKPEHKGFKTGKAKYGEGKLDWLPPDKGDINSGGATQSPQGSGAPRPAVWGSAEPWLVEKLLGLMPNDPAIYDYDMWIAIGMAVKAACGEAGRELWRAWSETVHQEADLDEKWGSFDPSTTKGVRKLMLEAELRSGPSRVAAACFDDDEVAVDDDLVVGLPRSTELHYADDIVAKWMGRLKWNIDRKTWLEFNGLWVPLNGRDRAAELSLEMARRAPPKSKGEADSRKSAFHGGVEAICRRTVGMQARETDFDKDPWLLGTPGGTVDLRSGVLGAARAGDLISRSTAVAPAQSENCPRWHRFLKEVTQGDPESVAFLQQYAGYCLTGLVSEEMFLFLFGPGGNGKSVFGDTLAGIMGSYFVKPAPDLFIKKAHGMGHKSVLAMLAGARFCTISEVPAGSQWDEGLLKDVTGGGVITACFKHKDEFTFEPRFKLMALGNHQPTFPGGIDKAIRRRFWMMGWLFEPKVADKGLRDTLRREWPGILRWAINGAAMWAKTGLLKPAAVEAFTEEFVAEQDLVAQWMAAVIEKVPGSTVPAQDLFRSWIEWRNGQGDHQLLDNVNVFGAEMKKKRGLAAKPVKTGTVYLDIRLKANASGVFEDFKSESK